MENDLTSDQEVILRALSDRAIKAVIVGGVSRRPVDELAAREFVTYETATVAGPFPSSHSHDDITVRITLAGWKWIWAANQRNSN